MSTRSGGVTQKIDGSHPVIEAAHKARGDGIVTLSSGVRIKVSQVSSLMLNEVNSKFKLPDPPMFYIEDKGIEEPNPSDPVYLKAVEEHNNRRGIAGFEAILIFGVELVDPIPEDRRWLRKLRLVGIEVDESDAEAVEFAYKKHIAVKSPDDMQIILASSNLTEESIKEAEEQFRR